MTTTQTTLRTDVLVIGAGQAGLAAGYHLAAAGHRRADRRSRLPGRRCLATSLRLAEAVLAGGLRLAARHAVSAPEARVPDRPRDGRLPRVVRRQLRAHGRHGRPDRAAGSPRWRRPPVRCHRRRSSLRGGPGHRRHRRVPASAGAGLRDRARSRDPAAPFERLPQSLAARRWSRPGRRAEPFGRRPRPRDRRDPPGDRVRQVAWADPVLRSRADAAGLGCSVVQAFFWHVATLDTPIGRKMAPACQEGWRSPAPLAQARTEGCRRRAH